MFLPKQKYSDGWQFVRDTIAAYNTDVMDFGKKIGFDGRQLYDWMNENHDPKMMNFVFLCKGLSMLNGRDWHENARIIVNGDYRRGDKL